MWGKGGIFFFFLNKLKKGKEEEKRRRHTVISIDFSAVMVCVQSKTIKIRTGDC